MRMLGMILGTYIINLVQQQRFAFRLPAGCSSTCILEQGSQVSRFSVKAEDGFTKSEMVAWLF